MLSQHLVKEQVNDLLQTWLFSILRICCCLEHGVAHCGLGDHRQGCNVIAGVLRQEISVPGCSHTRRSKSHTACHLIPKFSNRPCSLRTGTLARMGGGVCLGKTKQGAKVTMRLKISCKNRPDWPSHVIMKTGMGLI